MNGLAIIKLYVIKFLNNIANIYSMDHAFREFIFNFLIGGGLIAGCGLVSQIFSGSLSGMIYSSIPIGLYYLYIYVFIKSGRKESGKYALFSIIGGIIWVLMAVLLYYLNYLPLKTNLLLSSVIYFIIAYITFKFFDKIINKD